jgi:hypothetical protein
MSLRVASVDSTGILVSWLDLSGITPDSYEIQMSLRTAGELPGADTSSNVLAEWGYFRSLLESTLEHAVNHSSRQLANAIPGQVLASSTRSIV